MIETLTQFTQLLPEQVITIILLISLVAVFYIAYKIMSMVVQTVIIAILSGGFYTALTFIVDLPLNIENILLFTVLGASLFLIYTALATTYTIAKTTISIPIHIIEIILKPFQIIYKQTKKTISKHKEKQKDKKNKEDREKKKRQKKQKKKENKNKEDKSETKEVVIDKVQKENKNKED